VTVASMIDFAEGRDRCNRSFDSQGVTVIQGIKADKSKTAGGEGAHGVAGVVLTFLFFFILLIFLDHRYAVQGLFSIISR
jgi:hypothetical protein